MMDESSRAVVLRDKQLLNNQPDTVVGNKEQKTAGVTEDSERNKECEEKEYRSQRAPTLKQEERQRQCVCVRERVWLIILYSRSHFIDVDPL